jgi:hypothetical protein
VLALFFPSATSHYLFPSLQPERTLDKLFKQHQRGITHSRKSRLQSQPTFTIYIMLQIDAPVLAALITGTVAILVGVISNYMIRKKEDRTRRLQIELEYTSKQIQEFYGPLMSLIEQIYNIWGVRQKITQTNILTEEDKRAIFEYLQKTRFHPLHDEIKGIATSA